MRFLSANISEPNFLTTFLKQKIKYLRLKIQHFQFWCTYEHIQKETAIVFIAVTFLIYFFQIQKVSLFNFNKVGYKIYGRSLIRSLIGKSLLSPRICK